MRDVLTDTAAAPMARAFEQNYEGFFSALLAGSGRLSRDDELTVGVSEIPGVIFNGVYRSQFRVERVPEEITARVTATLRTFTEKLFGKLSSRAGWSRRAGETT